jgi:tetratricopeptide (TPR) repeat protein
LERSGPRRTLFAIITLLLPFALLGALEVVLRYTGVAAPEPLFVPAPEPGWLQPNERVIQRFFAAPAAAPAISIDTAYFRASKEPGSFRAFVIGGSTAAGFPYGKWASLAGILEQRLQREHPGRTIEVIPVAMSAINTWSLADFTAEILAQSPDAVLVYAGHNEYLGVLGVGSAFGGGSPRVTGLVMQARRLRIVALALRLSGTLAERAPSGEHEPATLMARVAAERRIPFGSGLYQAGVAQFSANLDRLLGDYQGHGVPVFIATLVSNDRDQPPFMPVPPPGTADRDWRERFTAALSLLTAGDRDGAAREAERMLAEAPNSGEGHFLHARALLAERDPAQARTAFEAARDRDALRFRAPGEFNEVIRQAATRHGATLVDVQAAFAAATPDGIIGDTLMLEHLHPNAGGYLLLAQSFHAALVAAEIPAGGTPLGDAVAVRDAPLTEIERLAGEYRVARLKADWPFHERRQPFSLPAPANEPERIARDWFEGRIDWLAAMNRALAHYQQAGDYDEAARIAVNLATAFPFRADAQYIAGALLLRNDDPQRALPFLDAAARRERGNTRHLMSLAQAWHMLGRNAESLQVLERVLAIDPGHPTAAAFIARLREPQEPH